MTVQFAPGLWGIPVVQSTVDRGVQFPTPQVFQRVHNLGTGSIEMWSGTSWFPVLTSVVSVADFFSVYGGGVALSDATAIDCTNAIAAAIATGNNVVIPTGIVGFTGGVLQTAANGQRIVGAGMWADDTDPKGGTKLLKLSGTGFGLKIRAYKNQVVSDLTIDNNGLAGDALLDTGLYSTVDRVCLQRVGGTDYCFHANTANVGTYSRLIFPDTINGASAISYGHIHFEFGGGAGYSEFNSCTGGYAGAGGNIYVNDSTSIAFNTCHFDAAETGTASVRVSGASDSVLFNGHTVESISTTTPVFSVSTASVIRNVAFTGCRVSRQADTTQPTFAFSGGSSKLISGVHLTNTVVTDNVSGGSTAGWVNVRLDGVRQFSNTGMVVNSPSNFYAHDCTGGTRSDNVQVQGHYDDGTGVGTNRWIANALYCVNDRSLQTFLSGMDEPATFINCGQVTPTNFPANSTLIVLGGASLGASTPAATLFAVGVNSGLPGAKSSASGPVGSVIAKEAVYNQQGTLLGYRPIYDAIT